MLPTWVIDLLGSRKIKKTYAANYISIEVNEDMKVWGEFNEDMRGWGEQETYLYSSIYTHF